MIKIADDATKLIGGTPLVRLGRIGAETGAQLIAKLPASRTASV